MHLVGQSPSFGDHVYYMSFLGSFQFRHFRNHNGLTLPTDSVFDIPIGRDQVFVQLVTKDRSGSGFTYTCELEEGQAC